MEALTKAMDESIAYSYQQNLKKVGLPQKNERETAEETTSLCHKIFKKIGVDGNDTDIDIAHRDPTRNQNGRRRRRNAIVRKSVRRMVSRVCVCVQEYWLRGQTRFASHPTILIYVRIAKLTAVEC